MTKKAFTLIEVLVVITMITVLVGVFVLDFNSARERQQVLLLAEQSVALMQQSHAEVQAGAVTEGEWVCRGAYFELGEVPQLAEALFLTETLTCDWDNVQSQDYGLNTKAQVMELSRGSFIYALFEPPDGHFVIYDGAGVVSEDAQIVLGSEDVDTEFILQVSALTGQSSLIQENDEE